MPSIMERFVRDEMAVDQSLKQVEVLLEVASGDFKFKRQSC